MERYKTNQTYLLIHVCFKIDFPEFLMLMTGFDKADMDEHDDSESRRARMIREREEDLCDLFMIFDKDKSGSISADELSHVMLKFGDLDKTLLELMVNEVDSNGDGLVMYITIKH